MKKRNEDSKPCRIDPEVKKQEKRMSTIPSSMEKTCSRDREREKKEGKPEEGKKERSQRDDTQNRRRTTTRDRATAEKPFSNNDYSRPDPIVGLRRQSTE